VKSGKLEDVGEALAKTPEVIEASGTEGGGERERGRRHIGPDEA
jgi:hypothetical protein